MNVFLQNTSTLHLRIQDKAKPPEGQPKREESIGKFPEIRRIEPDKDITGSWNSPQAALKLP